MDTCFVSMNNQDSPVHLPFAELEPPILRNVMEFLETIIAVATAIPEVKNTILDDDVWKRIIRRDFYPCHRIWKVLENSNEAMITLYNNVMKQRKIVGLQLANELKEEERIQAHLKAKERLRVVFLIYNIVFSWLSLPYLGILQVILFVCYFCSLIRSLTLTLLPIFLILYILITDIVLNFFAWLVNKLDIQTSILSNQWDNMGYTFVKFTYEELFHEKKSSFFFMFSLFVTLFCFVLFLGLQVDEYISWSWIAVFIPFWIALLIVFLSVPWKSFSQPAFVVWRLLLFLFGIPIFVFTILLVIRLEWLPSLNLWVVFIPLWFMDLVLTIFMLGPTVYEVFRQVVMRNTHGILDTLDILCFYSFLVFPKIVCESLFCIKEYISNLSLSFVCIPLFVIMAYVCVITTSVCVNSFSFHRRIFSFYFPD